LQYNGSQLDVRDLLEMHLLEKHPSGFHRDVHDIMLIIVEMFGFGAMAAWKALSVPLGFQWTLDDCLSQEFGIRVGDLCAADCYRQLVLLSGRDQHIVARITNYPTFGESPWFQEFFKTNKDLLESKAFAADVEKFSLRDGSEFVKMRNELGADKVDFLWKGMAPNPALRPILFAFMTAFFKDQGMAVLQHPEDELGAWYESLGEEEEVVPLFLDKSHAEMMLGSGMDTFVLKGD